MKAIGAAFGVEISIHIGSIICGSAEVANTPHKPKSNIKPSLKEPLGLKSRCNMAGTSKVFMFQLLLRTLLNPEIGTKFAAPNIIGSLSMVNPFLKLSTLVPMPKPVSNCTGDLAPPTRRF